MKMPIMLRSTHEEIVNDFVCKKEKIDELEKKVKDLNFCLDACKKDNKQLTNDNFNVMRTLKMNKEIKRQIIDIIDGESNVKFTKDNIMDLVKLL